MGLPIMEIDPLGGRTIFEYDEVGRTTAVVNPLNYRIEYQYDERGNLIRHINPDGSHLTIEVNKQNKPVSVTDPSGEVWRFEWDDRGLQTHQHNPMGAVTSYKFDDNGLIREATDTYNESTVYGYDCFGNLSSVTDAMGDATHFTCDELGNVQCRTNSTGHTVHYRYDQESRLVELTKPDGRKILYTYNKEGDPIQHISEDGSCTRFDYQGISILSCRHEPNGLKVEYLHDTEERLVGIINQNGDIYKLKRDAIGRVIEERDYWGQITKYKFDLAGMLIEKCDPLDRVTNYNFDKLGRLIRKSFEQPEKPEKPFEERYTYDVRGNIIECENENIKVNRVFDAESRLVEEKQGDFVIKNKYDKLGRRIKRETSIGNIIQFEYDAVGRTKSIYVNDASIVDIERDSTGQVTIENLPNNLVRQYSYDALGRVNSISIKKNSAWLLNTLYEYDHSDSLTKRTNSSFGSESFKYDSLGHITEHVDATGYKQEYTHNSQGLHLDTRIVYRPALKAVGSCDLPDIWNRTGNFGDSIYQFDRAGNLSCKTKHSNFNDTNHPENNHEFTWNHNNQLIKSQTHECETTYKYDPFGRRICKETNGVTHNFYWDGDILTGDDAKITCNKTDRIIKAKLASSRPDLANTGNSEREFVYYPDSFVPLALVGDKEVYIYYTDINGSPTRLINANGDAVWEAYYNALGACNCKTNIIDNPLRLQGHYEDYESGLYYCRHRYYDPDIAQFISFDPLGLASGDTLEKYGPNPVTWVDPFGLNTVTSEHYSTSEHGRRLHAETQAYRKTHPDGLDGYRNFAAADVRIDGKPKTEFFVNDPSGMHSEQKLLAWEETMKKKGHKIEVVRLYTERKPCGPNSAYCSNTLANRYGKHMEVYHWITRGEVPCKR
jgi:RHS repeat-associated protein